VREPEPIGSVLCREHHPLPELEKQIRLLERFRAKATVAQPEVQFRYMRRSKKTGARTWRETLGNRYVSDVEARDEAGQWMVVIELIHLEHELVPVYIEVINPQDNQSGDHESPGITDELSGTTINMPRTARLADVRIKLLEMRTLGTADRDRLVFVAQGRTANEVMGMSTDHEKVYRVEDFAAGAPPSSPGRRRQHHAAIRISVVCGQHYFEHQKLSKEEAEDCEFKSLLEPYRKHQKDARAVMTDPKLDGCVGEQSKKFTYLQKYFCSFLNSNPGRLLFGVNDDSIVEATPILWEFDDTSDVDLQVKNARGKIRAAVDNCASQKISPPLPGRDYSTAFVPVLHPAPSLRDDPAATAIGSEPASEFVPAHFQCGCGKMVPLSHALESKGHKGLLKPASAITQYVVEVICKVGREHRGGITFADRDGWTTWERRQDRSTKSQHWAVDGLNKELREKHDTERNAWWRVAAAIEHPAQQRQAQWLLHKREHFHGRKWAASEILTRCSLPGNAGLLVIGGEGSGKSAFLADLASYKETGRPSVVGVHACEAMSQNDPAGTIGDVCELVTSLALQLAVGTPRHDAHGLTYSSHESGRLKKFCQEFDSTAFDGRGLFEAATKCHTISAAKELLPRLLRRLQTFDVEAELATPRLILIDLPNDEQEVEAESLCVINILEDALCQALFPPWLKLVVTARPENLCALPRRLASLPQLMLDSHPRPLITEAPWWADVMQFCASRLLFGGCPPAPEWGERPWPHQEGCKPRKSNGRLRCSCYEKLKPDYEQAVAEPPVEVIQLCNRCGGNFTFLKRALDELKSGTMQWGELDAVSPRGSRLEIQFVDQLLRSADDHRGRKPKLAKLLLAALEV
jgi:hypothetical protein